MTDPLRTILRHDRAPFFLFGVLSALALGIALISQYSYGLQPCVLCQYQRAPYVLVILLCLGGLLVATSRPTFARICMAAVSGAFFVNILIGIYHSGVERHWWRSFMEGCTIPQFEGSAEEIMAQISALPAARCDEVAWMDPILGLSMANYNAVFCLILAFAASYSAVHRTRNF